MSWGESFQSGLTEAIHLRYAIESRFVPDTDISDGTDQEDDNGIIRMIQQMIANIMSEHPVDIVNCLLGLKTIISTHQHLATHIVNPQIIQRLVQIGESLGEECRSLTLSIFKYVIALGEQVAKQVFTEQIGAWVITSIKEGTCAGEALSVLHRLASISDLYSLLFLPVSGTTIVHSVIDFLQNKTEVCSDLPSGFFEQGIAGDYEDEGESMAIKLLVAVLDRMPPNDELPAMIQCMLTLATRRNEFIKSEALGGCVIAIDRFYETFIPILMTEFGLETITRELLSTNVDVRIRALTILAYGAQNNEQFARAIIDIGVLSKEAMVGSVEYEKSLWCEVFRLVLESGDTANEIITSPVLKQIYIWSGNASVDVKFDAADVFVGMMNRGDFSLRCRALCIFPDILNRLGALIRLSQEHQIAVLVNLLGMTLNECNTYGKTDIVHIDSDELLTILDETAEDLDGEEVGNLCQLLQDLLENFYS